MKFLKRLFHKHQWKVVEQTPIDRTRYHCIYECEKCKKRTSHIIDLTYSD